MGRGHLGRDVAGGLDMLQLDRVEAMQGCHQPPRGIHADIVG